MAPNATQTASTLDVTARVLDLSRSLVESSNSSNTVVKVVFEIGQWLGREQLNRYELQDCLQKARAIALPNSTAQKLFDDMRKGIEESTAIPFLPRPSGSLGNLLVNDPNLSWMISSTVCLFQYHNFAEVTECVKDSILASQPRDGESYWDDAYDCPLYHPRTAHLHRVVKKLVSSIWLNVVNSKCMTMELPQELLSVCRVGHHLKGPRFGKLLHSLRANRPKIMIQSVHLLRNATLWLLLHFEGHLLVTVSGEIVYSERLGQSQREIELRVKMFCSGSGPCQEGNSKYELFEDIAGKLQSFLSGNYPSPSEYPERAMIRRKFYEAADLPSEIKAQHHSLQVLIKCTSQKIMRWLLTITVLPPYEFTNLGFSVALDQGQTQTSHRVKDILAQSPTMLNLRWGNQPVPSLVYAQPVFDERPSEDEESESGAQDPMLAPNRIYDELLPYFPILRDLLEEARPLCHCPHCKDTNSPSTMLVRGCLRHDALVKCLVILAHGVADGFGVSDVSGASDMNLAAHGMLQLLLELVEDKGILWDTWFGVAASVFLGCACPFLPISKRARESSGTTNAAIQHGNLAVIAPWLDLSKELKIERCFHLIETRGRLSIVRPNVEDKWYYGEIGEHAVIYTEQTEGFSSQRSKTFRETQRSSAEVRVSQDESLAETDWILSQIDESQYRLMMRIRSTHHSRIIDPSDAMIRLARAITSHKCRHEPAVGSLTVGPEQGAVLYSFRDLLGHWEKWDHSFRFVGHNPNRLLADASEAESQSDVADTIHATKVLDSYMKQNLAFALSVNENVILNDGSACVSCLLREANNNFYN